MPLSAMSFLPWLPCAALAWVLYRLCAHHPRRWRAPWTAAAGAGGFVAAACGFAQWSAGTGLAVACFVVLTVTMLWLALLPLLATWWRLRGRSGHGA